MDFYYQYVIYGLVGLTWLIFGVSRLTGEPVFVSRRVDMSLMWLVFVAPLINLSLTIPEFIDDSYTKRVIMVCGAYFLILILIFVVTLGKFSFINAKKTSVISMTIDILDNKNILYQLEESSIKLTDYDSKEIVIWGIGNSVEINLRGIRSLPIYKELIQSIKLQSKETLEKVFPLVGLLYIIVGLLLMFFAYKYYLLG